jgi:integrase
MSSAERKMQVSRFGSPTDDADTVACAINCTNPEGALAGDAVRRLIASSLSENTTRAYRSDISELAKWGGELPWSPELVAEYLASHAGILAIATLLRRLASAAKAHRALGSPDPTKSEVVTATMRGIRRTFGQPQRQAKALLREDLVAICRAMGRGTRDTRDRAIILIGFAGAFRRSELTAIDIEDIEEVRQGMVVHVRTSKTDQYGHGRKVAIPYGRTELCPVGAVHAWKSQSSLVSGPLFRPVDRHSNIGASRLAAEAVCSVVRERCAAAGYDPETYSGHSLRAGLATSAAIAGASSYKIRQQTGHASDAMLQRYIRHGDMWAGNAAGTVL